MMSIWDALLLGIIQALTEFLPVSSSGHLVLAQHFLGMSQQGSASYEIIVHLGTLVAVCFYFRKRLMELISGLIEKDAQKKSDWYLQIRFLILGTLPAGIIGLLFKKELTQLFGEPKIVAYCLLLTGIIVLLTGLAPQITVEQKQALDRHHLWTGLWVGLAQAIAILPGISRSGATIAMAIFLKLPKKTAAELSFLLSIPVIAGAGLLKAKDLWESPEIIDWTNAGVAFLSAMLLGYLVLDLMLKWLQKPSFSILGIYCIIISLIALFYLN